MITTRNAIYYLYLGVIGCVSMLTACQPTVIGPTKPSGYRMMVPSSLQMNRWQSLPLNVEVTDANGKPVDGVPVVFRLAPPHTTMAELAPQTVYSQNGKATTTLRAKTAGYVVVDVTVEDVTEPIYITIVGETPRF